VRTKPARVAMTAAPPSPSAANMEMAPLEPELPLPEVADAVELAPVRVGPEFDPDVPL
jgi:hypothetical protein